MGDLIAYWRYDNYKKDIAEGAGFNFNSKQSRLHSAIGLGESLWLITGRRETGRTGMAYYLVARLIVRSKTINSPDYQYGKYRVWGDLNLSKYFQAGASEVSKLLRGLRFSTDTPIGDTNNELALYFQTIREVNSNDSLLLDAWCAALPSEPAAYSVLPEQQLEAAVEQDSESVGKVIRENPSGLAEYRINQLLHQPSRSRSLSRQLHEMYNGRCQVCGFDPILRYGVNACQSHHLAYLSRGGLDTFDNLVLLCPNHHAVIHGTNAVFDFHDLTFVFASNHRERLILNQHLQTNK